jgi:hypothetical protein
MEGRVAEIDVASGKSGSRVDLRVGVWSGSLIGGGHLVMKSDEVIGVEAWNWKADISSCWLISWRGATVIERLVYKGGGLIKQMNRKFRDGKKDQADHSFFF